VAEGTGPEKPGNLGVSAFKREAEKVLNPAGKHPER